MSTLHYSLFFAGYLLVASSLYAQQEQEAEQDAYEFQHEELSEGRLQLYEMQHEHIGRLNLNKADKEDLENLGLLTPAAIKSFLEYREKLGPLVSIYELQAIPGWNIATIHRVRAHVEVKTVVDQKQLVKRILTNSNHFLTFRTDRQLQVAKGYLPDTEGRKAFLGSPYRLLVRYRNALSKDFSIGITMEKDPGERMYWDPSERRYGWDYLSFHAQLYHKGRWKAVGIGDYKIQFGQGLVFGGGFYTGKGAETILAVKRNNKGILPYTSVVESGFFRGACFTYSLFSFMETTLLFSSKNQDATLEYNEQQGTSHATAIKQDGIFRTENDLQKKNNSRKQDLGMNMAFFSARKKHTLGISVLHTYLEHPIYKPDRVYNRFDFSGSAHTVGSLDFSSVLQNNFLFGEAALTASGAKAWIAGCITALTPTVEVAYLMRRYDRNYHAFDANAFAEGTAVSNEQGSYWGLRWRATARWTLSAYYDYYRFRWLKYQQDAPAYGYDYLLRAQYIPARKIQLTAQFRYHEKAKNQRADIPPIDFLVPAVKNSFWVEATIQTGILSSRTRVQASLYRQDSSPASGFLIAQDISLNGRRLKLHARYALFDTELYETRQYLYEKDVLYAVSFPAYDGKGVRIYGVLQVKWGRALDIWLRYSNTRYINQKTLKTGRDEVLGNMLSELKLQIRYRFGTKKK
jgi:hypothetical protein